MAEDRPPLTARDHGARPWAGLAGRLLAQAPVSFEAGLRHAYSYLLPFHDWRVPVARLHGVTHASGRPASMLVAGAERWTRYLSDRFFAGAPRREPIGDVAIWKLPGRLRRLRAGADVTVVHVDNRSARRLFDGDYLCIPQWVGARLPLPVDLAAFARSSGRVAADLRRTRRGGLTHDVSHLPADFEQFYHRMFVPYTLARHGADAYIKDFHNLRRSFRSGGILWVRNNGHPVAGYLFEHDGDALGLVAVGVVDGDIAWRQRGAVAALYVHIIEYAQQSGCAAVDMRGVRPSLADGLLRYKAKWGAALYPRTDVPHSWLVHWNRLDGAAAEFLAGTPLVVRDGEGLSGVGLVDRATAWTNADLQQAHDRLWVPGLARLCLVGNASGADDPRVPAATRLVDHERVRAAGPRALLALLGGA